jgi:histidine phosphotransferase ChpT
MAVLQDMRVLELLASRICHDLISPVGAIGNGLELLEEMGAQVGEEAVKLIGHSSEQASRRLKLFRVCYGAAGADGNLTCDDVLTTARDYLAGSRVSLSWEAAPLKSIPDLPKGTAKVLLNAVLIAVEALVHGGTINVLRECNTLSIQAEGRGAGQRSEAWPALNGDIPTSELSARSIHPHVTRCFADHYGVKIEWEQPSEDRLDMRLTYAIAQT